MILSGKKYFMFLVLALSFIAILAVSFPVQALAVLDQPEVETENESNVTATSARLNGYVDTNGLTTRVWFEYGRSRNDLDLTTPRSNYSSSNKAFSWNVTGLRTDTLYYFRAVAENDDGRDFGRIISFRTNNNNYNDYYYNNNYDNQNYYSAYNDQYYYQQNQNRGNTPTALTSGATVVSNTSARLNATILNYVNTPSVAWFEWGLTPSLGYKTSPISLGSASSLEHIHTLTGLAPGTLYYFRAVAENAYWRNIGSTLSFVTGGVRPVTQSANTTIIIQEQSTKEKTTTTEKKEVETADKEISPNLSANVILAGSFLPNSIFGWLVLVILFLVLVMEIRYLYTGSVKRTHAEHSDH